jgi:hypothetical protein
MNKMLVVGGLFLALLVPSAFGGSQRTQATVLCVELHGNPETRFDVKRRPGSKCPRGEDKVTLPRGPRGPAAPAGAQGPAGPQGPAGAAGAKGDAGPAGAAGAKGATGATGPSGPPGQNAAAPEYGVAAVDVTRGGSTSTWSVYSTALGSPLADTTGGTFRFTCSTAQAPCFVAVKAAALSDGAGTVLFYPRVSISKDGTQETAPQPRTYCEYADGSGPTVFKTLTKQPKSATPAYEAVKLDVGTTADCFGVPGGLPGGVVNSIELPPGFYNVTTSVAFHTQAADPPPRD